MFLFVAVCMMNGKADGEREVPGNNCFGVLVLRLFYCFKSRILHLLHYAIELHRSTEAGGKKGQTCTNKETGNIVKTSEERYVYKNYDI
jgi:hypothetical protein